MELLQIMSTLKELGNDTYRANIVKLGIPAEKSFGASTGDIRKLANQIKKSNEMAYALWDSGYHDAKLLAVLVFDKKRCTLEDIEKLMKDVHSWDLCDHLCKNLILELDNYATLITTWCKVHAMYYKRAAFTLIASSAIHQKIIEKEQIKDYLCLIQQASDDKRLLVKKAISWALREIGKRDFDCQEQALITAYELCAMDGKSQKWIGENALKELADLIQVDGRTRLISANSKMGKLKTCNTIER